MLVAPVAESYRSDLPFRYVGGDASLDLVNTVDWTSNGLERDRLVGYAGLIRWAQGAHIVVPGDALALRIAAEEQPQQADAALEACWRVRWLFKRLFSSLMARTVDEYAFDEFNEVLTDSLRHLSVTVEGGPAAQGHNATWSWRGLGERLESPLWPVVWSAAILLTASEAAQVRVCGGPDCGWLFVDRSRNGLRRWCEMATCGTAAKSRRRAERGRTPADSVGGDS